MVTVFQSDAPAEGTTIPVTVTNSYIVVVSDGVTQTLPAGATPTGMYSVVYQTMTSKIVVKPTQSVVVGSQKKNGAATNLPALGLTCGAVLVTMLWHLL